MTTIGGVGRPSRAVVLSAASREGWKAFVDGYRTGIREPRPDVLDLASVPKGAGWTERHRMTSAASLSLPDIPTDEDGPFGHHWPARYVYELGAGRVDALSGLAFVRGSVVKQSGPPLRDPSWVAAVAGSRRRLDDGRAGRRIDGPLLPLGRDPITGYYHWTVDFLPRILHVRRIFPDVTLVGPKIKTFVRGCLEALDVRFVETDQVVEAANIVLADHTEPSWCHPEDAIALRDWAASIPAPPIGAEKIYVSRRGARREMLNEAAFEETLRSRGFFIADGGSIPDYRTQLGMFAEARLIVGQHGAGLSNMVWSAGGARVLELSVEPSGSTPSHESAMVRRLFGSRLFRNLAAACGHAHERISVASTDAAAYGDAAEVEPRVLEAID